MRILVISDIHANLTALEAVIADVGEIDATWCLGDLVGYGPDPNECIQRVLQLPNLLCLIGNHDAAVIGQIEIDSFNPEARQAVVWTQQNLTSANAAYLRSLPERALLNSVTLVHGSPRQPVWEYLLDTRTATQNFAHFETPFCFVGHSHLPVIYQLNAGRRSADLIIPETDHHIAMAPRAIFNPGSVGQPRDRDPRASYAVFEPEEHIWDYRRVPYDVTSVQERMQAHDLPTRHIYRLSGGW
jgi:predicted phosphodiesterase